MTDQKHPSRIALVIANVLLVVWVVVWPLTAFMAFVDGFDFSPAAPARSSQDSYFLLTTGLLVGVLVPLAAAWISRKSRPWRRVSLACAVLGAISVWMSYGIS